MDTRKSSSSKFSLRLCSGAPRRRRDRRGPIIQRNLNARKSALLNDHDPTQVTIVAASVIDIGPLGAIVAHGVAPHALLTQAVEAMTARGDVTNTVVIVIVIMIDEAMMARDGAAASVIIRVVVTGGEAIRAQMTPKKKTVMSARGAVMTQMTVVVAIVTAKASADVSSN